MHISYDTKGICAAKIDFDLEEGKVYNLKFNSGCDGNHKGLAKLVEGMPAEELINTTICENYDLTTGNRIKMNDIFAKNTPMR